MENSFSNMKQTKEFKGENETTLFRASTAAAATSAEE